ncbi:mitochondrial 54S ribosomal protein YmL23 [Trichodelitschia bisporula]|uniref:Large ribosomal subunit protein uL13m n=1 Tax=Trichodelitschia bisporula TaxID=703511 RepID=A0A6G1HS28_9PEZI|nr:mitochondrial 54S ribosomal protein YmL23 [Trichodelitschia bisporula]
MSQAVGKTRLAYARPWHLLDITASPLPLGRLASRIALTLMGKHKPMYDPSTDCGDYIVAVGCQDLRVTGRKMAQKMYYTHTTRPGSLKAMSMERVMDKWGGAEILRRAVRGMLPKNRLRDVRLRRLKAFEGHEHPFKQNVVKYYGQKPAVLQEIEARQAQKEREAASAAPTAPAAPKA